MQKHGEALGAISGMALILSCVAGCGGHTLGGGLAEKMRSDVVANCAAQAGTAACTDLRVRTSCRYTSSYSAQRGAKWQLYRCTVATSSAATNHQTRIAVHTGYVMPSEEDPFVSAYFDPPVAEPIGTAQP